MADVRALLRAERAARAPSKPKAPAKAVPPAPVHSGKKRKAPEEEEDDTRKRARATSVEGISPDFFDNTAASPAKEAEDPSAEEQSEPQPQKQPEIDEDEWAAFERDVAAPTHEPSANILDNINASNAISSAPMTAEELAAQAREEQSAQRSRRDAEIEGEREDAEQALAEEFEEMEALEERVKKLRERREGLRRRSVLGKDDGGQATSADGADTKKGTDDTRVDESDEENDYDEDDFMLRRPRA